MRTLYRLSGTIPGALLAAWGLLIPAAQASVITSAEGNIMSPCAAFDSHTGTASASASAHCVFQFPQFPAAYDSVADASVSGSDPFSLLSVDASVTPFAINFNNLSAGAQASMSQLVAITGGSGAGTVSYTFLLTGLVTGDDSASLHGGFGVSSGGSSQSFLACDVTTPVLSFNCGKTIVTNAFPFTFNSAFQLTAGLNVLVETIGHGGNSSMTAQLTGITVRDASGLVLPDAQLTAVPEPGPAGFVIAGLFIFAGVLSLRLKRTA